MRRRFQLDASVQRFGSTLLGGSPLRLFRTTDAGAAVLDRVAAGEHVDDSVLIDRLLDAGAIHPSPEAGRFTADDVTVVVPAFMTSGSVGRMPGATVVDDASPTPIAGATIRLTSNRGPGAARNAGLELVTTPLVAFVDTDVTLTAGWLDALLAHFDDPTVALVAPRVRTPPVATVLGGYEHASSPLDLGSQPGHVRAGTRVSYVPAAAIVCRVDALRAVGGFDESLRYGEDVDLVWRLDAAGHRCRYEPASTVWHAARGNWRDWARQRIAYGSSSAPLAVRHPTALAPVRLSGWSVGVWALAVARRPLLAAALAVGTGVALVPKLRDIPPRTSIELAVRGNWLAGAQLARAVRRAWWPLLAVAAVRSRTARRALVMSAIAAGNPIRIVDEAAFSVGLWHGVWTERTLLPLLPAITAWPGKQADSPTQHATAR